ncbi:hypothetical protein BC834DRAFT_975244 [Gloeopeniophorella convolvens]|nr:hypothetical protein BC834DRAFT_975244 [Gloeopeniophorella convolvens]
MSYRPDETSFQLFTERAWLQGAILSAVAYGSAFTLFAICLNILIKQTNRTNIKIKGAFIAYITILFILGTIFMVSSAEFTQLAFIDNRNFPGGPAAYENAMFSIPVDMAGNAAFVLTTWFADALLVWRCMVIYKGCQFPLWVIMAFPCLVYTASVVMGILWLKQLSTTSPYGTSASINWTIPCLSISLALNILVSIAIVIRLLVYRRRISLLMGRHHGSQYTSIAAMIIESASIYSAFSIFFLVPFGMNSPVSEIVLQSLSEIQICTTLLIVFRVAQGKGWSQDTTTQVFSKQKPSQVRMGNMSATRFQAASDPSKTIVMDSYPSHSGVTIHHHVFSKTDVAKEGDSTSDIV